MEKMMSGYICTERAKVDSQKTVFTIQIIFFCPAESNLFLETPECMQAQVKHSSLSLVISEQKYKGSSHFLTTEKNILTLCSRR